MPQHTDKRVAATRLGNGGECRKGGDVIALVANARHLSPKEAAEAIARQFGGERAGTVPDRSPQPPPQEKGALKPLDYLQSDHEAVRALGLSEETAQAFAMGYAPKGILRGRVAVPIRDQAGVLLAYCGIAASNEQSPRFLFPSNFDPASAIFNADRIAAGELNLLGNIVQVLEAFAMEHELQQLGSVWKDERRGSASWRS